METSQVCFAHGVEIVHPKQPDQPKQPCNCIKYSP